MLLQVMRPHASGTTCPHFEQCSDVDPEKVAQQYKDFILDLLSIIARPLKPVLARSLARAFEGVSNQDADHRAGRIAAATQYFGYKSKSFKTGGKTSPAVAEIIQKLLEISSQSRGCRSNFACQGQGLEEGENNQSPPRRLPKLQKQFLTLCQAMTI